MKTQMRLTVWPGDHNPFGLLFQANGLVHLEATDFFDAVMHGLTAAHMANQPELPAGTGRFGSLIPATVRFFRAAWGIQEENQRKEHNGARD